MDVRKSNLLPWVLLGVGLLFLTFGSYAVLFGFYVVAFIGGALVIIHHCGKEAAKIMPDGKQSSDQHFLSPGIIKIKESMEPSTKIKNFDKRMTGASVIDDVLKEVLEFVVRDYIKTWYRQLSDHDNFLMDIWQCAQKVVITFSSRSKDVNWMPYFTQRLVDDFASHIRLYKRASERVVLAKNEDNAEELEDVFFDLEVDMENDMCRDLVCTDPDVERQYLQDLSEVLLFLLLPPEDFHNKPFRYIVREVLVNGIFLPTVDLLSDPDYINQYIAWLCYETSFTRETFLTVIRSSDCMEELEAVRDKNLNSLMFLRDTCDMRMRRLEEGPVSEQIIDEPESLRYQSLYVLTLEDIFNNNLALQAFIEYMTGRNGQQYLYFYLNVEGFRTAAEQQISEMQKLSQDSLTTAEPDLESLRRAAKIIFDQYLAEKASSKLRIEPGIVKYTVQKMKLKMMSEDIFDVVQARVYQILHTEYYEDFLQCPAYVKLLGELGLLDNKDDEDSCSVNDGRIVFDELGYRKVSARWVPEQLTDNHKEQRLDICRELLRRSKSSRRVHGHTANASGDLLGYDVTFLDSIVTGDETWLHHCTPETKQDSMTWKHPSSPVAKKFKVMRSAKKIMGTFSGTVVVFFCSKPYNHEKQSMLEVARILWFKEVGEVIMEVEITCSMFRNVYCAIDGSIQPCSEGSIGSMEDLVDSQCDEHGEDSISVDSMSSVASTGSPTGDAYLFASVSQTGVVKESDKSGKSYAIFAVTVRKKEPYSEEEEIWDVYRRYSDFHDLHMILSEKFPELTVPHLPGKTVLKNTSQTFLDRRRRDLDKYLKGLMKPELLQNVPGLEDLMNQFLHTGIWEKHKSEFSRKMDTIVNPIKSASKSMGNAVKSVPDGMSKIGDGIGKVFTSQKQVDHHRAREMMNQLKVGASLDPEAMENIPLRIMLLLMDEVFDLRNKNQWLRRRIVAILRQLIKAMLGDKINRKIEEHVDLMTSAEQVAEYVAAFRNSFWPNGILAEARSPRDEATKMRTRVLCKAKMLGSVPDEVRTLMGTDAVRKGVARIFQMFQYKTLNKRIVYVVLEGVLANLFPENKFQNLFRKLHSKSKRAEKVREQQKMAATQESQLRKRAAKR
ncbi:sorting nexin-13 [Elysia marginata]|uniref:Sorting nexin-13 n=1 Tax=Elysia marginata TaxID=1093978 RepID=A0AAV4HBE9_9GAST|nr:sorting nexin-13 [Elysia marginata]